MGRWQQNERFINLCRAAKEMRGILGDELYRTELPRILAPFTRVGRLIGLRYVRVKDYENATTALRARSAEQIQANAPLDALLERVMVENWCKKNGYELKKITSTLDKPKSPE